MAGRGALAKEQGTPKYLRRLRTEAGRKRNE